MKSKMIALWKSNGPNADPKKQSNKRKVAAHARLRIHKKDS